MSLTHGEILRLQADNKRLSDVCIDLKFTLQSNVKRAKKAENEVEEFREHCRELERLRNAAQEQANDTRTALEATLDIIDRHKARFTDSEKKEVEEIREKFFLKAKP